MRRFRFVSTLLARAGCPAPAHVASNYSASLAAWSVDRGALPEGTLRVLRVADCSTVERNVIQGGGRTRLDLPVLAYLFVHPTRGAVLIDTGYGRRTAADPRDYPGRLVTRLLNLRMEPGAAVVDRLPEAGLAAGDVEHIVLTHMHGDHVGGLEDLPLAQVWASGREWESAFEATVLGRPDTRPFAGHGQVRRFDFAGTAPYGPFDGHVDLFGDGSLILLPTPGHTPGHLSVLVNLRSGSFLVAGDCAWIDRHWQEVLSKGRLVRTLEEDDWRLNLDSLRRVNDWAARFPDLVVLPGHEVANLGKLPAWPAEQR